MNKQEFRGVVSGQVAGGDIIQVGTIHLYLCVPRGGQRCADQRVDAGDSGGNGEEDSGRVDFVS